jgi:hypothetical protein
LSEFLGDFCVMTSAVNGASMIESQGDMFNCSIA